MKHRDCGGDFIQWVAGGHFCYLRCEKCGHYALEDQDKIDRKIRSAVGGCRNHCCQPRRA